MISMEQKKILLVDDVRLFLNLEETFFRRTGCSIFTAQTGEQALEIARNEKPDLILLDMLMPKMNGDEVCRKIKSDPELSGIKIIMVTTQSDEETQARCREAGCDDYITKPINQKELIRKAARHLNVPYRVHFRILVRVEVEGESDQGFFMGTSADISFSGMLLETDKKLPPDSTVVLQFVIPGENEPLRIRGKVARVDDMNFKEKVGLGIEFKEMDNKATELLSNFIQTRTPGEKQA